MDADEYQPKTIRNLWATVRLIWDAALAQGYVGRVLPKPRLPRVSRKVPKYPKLSRKCQDRLDQMFSARTRMT
jgi:hypothetical protein